MYAAPDRRRRPLNVVISADGDAVVRLAGVYVTQHGELPGGIPDVVK